MQRNTAEVLPTIPTEPPKPLPAHLARRAEVYQLLKDRGLHLEEIRYLMGNRDAFDVVEDEEWERLRNS